MFTLSGERTNITYYSDVRIPDAWRIGDVDGGWRVMTVSLQDEHSAGFGGRIASSDREHRGLGHRDHRRRRSTSTRRSRGPRAVSVGPHAEHEVSVLLQRRGAWMVEQGMVPEAEGPMSKLYSSEALERVAQDLTEMVGADALRSYFDPTAPRGGRIEHTLRFSVGTTIYAGTSEVQRNIIAQRGLGLPR